MPHAAHDFAEIRAIQDFPSLVKYLRTELGWPVDEEQVDDLTFDYSSAELGLDERLTVKVRQIKQLRPLAAHQPWGIFWIDFEPKRLPVVIMRRILAALVRKQRGQPSSRATWQLPDLMFISATGEGQQRGISFAHFQEDGAGKSQLRTFSWDVRETHLYYIRNLSLEALRWPAAPNDPNAWRAQWSSAFQTPHGYVPKTAQALAEEMARIAYDIRQAVAGIYSMEHVGGPLHQIHLSLKMSLITDLEADEFADMYAQTVTYGLFAARATRQGEFAPAPDSSSVAALIAHTNPFLRELLEQLANQQSVDLDELGISALVDLLRQVDMEAILRDFGRQKRGEDPVIHFYETFMKHYDPHQKTKRGEFYTPDPAVSFIVRSVDHLLCTEFGYPDGLADTGTMTWQGQEVPRVQVLDPATGTGTFPRYIIEVIWETFYHKTKSLSVTERKTRWNVYVRQHLLPRLFAFELKMAPYTIAHMKLGLTLQEKGFEFQDGDRLQVYLSNALQPAHEVARVDTPALAHEVERANRVKAQTPITIVVGNPPYSGHSANASRDAQGAWNFIGQLLQDYYKVDGQPLGEKNPKWLQDDYVKFLRFAQWRITQTGQGILAMITNHGYLDNPTFRGMRQSLMQTFSEIYVLDLHGNTKKKETAPDGSKDENVFDIQQGVAICLMVRRPGASGLAQVFHADLYGLQEYKYEWLITHHKDIASVAWKELFPQSPHYLFIPLQINLLEEYERGFSIPQIFPITRMGVTSGDDNFVYDWSIDDFQRKIELVLKTHQWPKSQVQTKILVHLSEEHAKFIYPANYRPFDSRFILFSSDVVWRPVEELGKHFILGSNIGLVTVRRSRELSVDNYFVINRITDKSIISSVDNAHISPLYIFPDSKLKTQQSLFEATITRRPNFSLGFTTQIQETTSFRLTTLETGDLQTTFGPEDIFHYIYAILHSPSYRSRYAEFLKIDFPRLPLTSSQPLFRQLCRLGGELVSLHLLESPLLAAPPAHFQGAGDNVVAKGYPKYSQETVWINPAQGFAPIPQAVWEFHIGGYQVCEKWLKDRRGRALSAEDIDHYRKVTLALGETIRIMAEIDAVITEHGGWPIQ